MSTWRDFNRLKGQAYRTAARSFALDVIGDEKLARDLLQVDDKLQQKIIQNAIKPLVRMATKEWKSGIKAARTASRRKNSRRVRRQIARDVKSVMPSGKGQKSLRGYSIMRNSDTISVGGDTGVSAAFMTWLEFGTRPHKLGRGSSLRRKIQHGRRHPGARPVTEIRRRMQKLRPVADRMFEAAIRSGIESGGQIIKAAEAKRIRIRAEAA